MLQRLTTRKARKTDAPCPTKSIAINSCYLKINTASDLRCLRVRPAQGRRKVVNECTTFAHAEGEKEIYRNASRNRCNPFVRCYRSLLAGWSANENFRHGRDSICRQDREHPQTHQPSRYIQGSGEPMMFHLRRPFLMGLALTVASVLARTQTTEAA